MPRIVSSLALLILGAALFAAPSAPPKEKPLGPVPELAIAGWYTVTGSIPGSADYAGVVLIARHGEGYRLHWQLEDGSHADGLGLRDGNTLAVATQSLLVCRFAITEVEGKPRLTGKFIGMAGMGGTETLTWLRPLDGGK